MAKIFGRYFLVALTSILGLALPLSAISSTSDLLTIATAVTKENKSPIGRLKELWSSRRLKKPPKGGFCIISPAENKLNDLEVWDTHPIIIWGDSEVTRVKVSRVDNTEDLLPWDHAITDQEQLQKWVRYGTQNNQKPDPEQGLKPGHRYILKFSYKAGSSVEESEIRFDVIDKSERRSIDEQLNNIKKQQPDQAFQERSLVFANNELWTDFLREIFTANGLSPDLQREIEEYRKEIIANECYS